MPSQLLSHLLSISARSQPGIAVAADALIHSGLRRLGGFFASSAPPLVGAALLAKKCKDAEMLKSVLISWPGRPSVVQQVAHDDKAVADGFG